jgi:hypothetical protein
MISRQLRSSCGEADHTNPDDVERTVNSISGGVNGLRRLSSLLPNITSRGYPMLSLCERAIWPVRERHAAGSGVISSYWCRYDRMVVSDVLPHR